MDSSVIFNLQTRVRTGTWISWLAVLFVSVRIAASSSTPVLPAVFVGSPAGDSCRYRVHQVGFSACFENTRVQFQLAGQPIALEFAGASRKARLAALERVSGTVTYLLGSRGAAWRSTNDIAAGIVYRGIYEGIDAVYTTGKGRLKAEFVVAPGADPGLIRLAFDGARTIRVDDGGLRLETESGVLRESPLYVFQQHGDGTRVVEAEYRLNADGTVGFRLLDPYDPALALHIDPVLTYSTYLGGSGTDRVYAVAAGADGSAYVAGYTDSIGLNTSATAYQKNTGGGADAFIAKLSPDGSTISYLTYLGGTADDRAHSIAIDSSGNVYVTGSTTSSNFPVLNAYRGTLAGGRDAFVAKLNAGGTALVFSTYLGGAGTDIGNTIAVDGSANIYIAGSTTSANFPVSGAAQSTVAGQADAFVTKLNAAGNTLGYSTYLGGKADDKAYGIAVDTNGAAVVAGVTSSTNFPTASAAQAAIGGGQDIFVTKLAPAGSSIQVSTFFGGLKTESMEIGHPLALDAAGAAYIAGTTTSTNLPVVTAPYPVYRGGSSDAFVAKLTSAGSSLAFSTYIGGSALDYGIAVSLTEGTKPYLVGYTASSNFPTVNTGPLAIAGGYDVFAIRLNAAGTQVERNEIFGGVDSDAAYGIATDAAGNLYIAGQTGSVDFPLQSAVQDTSGGGLSGFVMKIPSPGVPTLTSVAPSSGSGAIQTFTLQASDSDGHQDLTEIAFLVAETSEAVAGCMVRYKRSPNTIELRDDAGTGWLGPVVVGAGNTLENSYCVVSTASATAAGTGSNLTVTLPVTFRGSFAGVKNLYGRVTDSSGTGGDWQNRGTWTVPAGGVTPVTLVSVTPASGSGAQGAFVFAFSSVFGYADVKWAFTNFTGDGLTVNACMGRYIQSTNQFELASNSGSGWVGSGTVGVAGTVENSQCRVDLGASSVTGTGSVLQLTLGITFKSGFGGIKNIMMAALSNSDILTNWTAKGTWNVDVPSAPVSTSVTPASGSGSSQMFDFVYSDANGYADITWTAMLIHSSLTPTASCLIRVMRATNVVELASDAGSFGGGVAIGSGGVIQNSQCSIDATASSMSGSGANLTVHLQISFKPAYTGAKNVYMTVADTAGAVAPWSAKGVWTVP